MEWGFFPDFKSYFISILIKNTRGLSQKRKNNKTNDNKKELFVISLLLIIFILSVFSINSNIKKGNKTLLSNSC